MATRIFCRLLAALGFGVAIAGAALGQPVDTRCIESGGQAICTEPTIVASNPYAAVDNDKWNYNVCDVDAPNPWREVAWCTVLGGCGMPIFDGGIGAVSTAFETIVQKPCQLNVTDTGWGQTLPANLFCWSGAPQVQNRKVVRDFRILNFSGLTAGSTGCNVAWKDKVFAIKVRAVACPAGYGVRNRANGDYECWKIPTDCTTVGNPINLLDGCKVQREVDYRSRTPGGVGVERIYNSSGYFGFDAAPERATDVWRTTWDRRIVMPATVGSVLAYAQRADGLLQVFGTSGKELQNARGGGSAILERLADSLGAATGWRLTTADKDIETYDAAGRLQSIAQRTGFTHTLTYDANGRLASATDVFGGTVSFTYDSAGRISGFVAPGNRVYRYGYDELGRLTSVTYPDNAVRTYHYENVSFMHALTGITDENGQRYATWVYDGSGRATMSQHAGGAEAVSLSFGSFSTTANEGMTAVTDAFGTTHEYYYQIAGGQLRTKRLTENCPTCAGTNSTYAFDSNGNVASFTDFNGNRTTYSYDLNRNLETSRTEAYGTSLARTITTQWHPAYRLPTKITAPSSAAGVNEITDFVYDAQGNLTQKTVSAGVLSRQWNSTYTALGQVSTIDGPRTDVPDVTTYTYYDATDPCVGCRGNVRTIANALGHVTTFASYDVDGQPTQILDPNGVATTMTYDVRGRLMKRSIDAGSPAAETTSFDYDSVGQVVKVTMPDASFVRYQYDAAHRLTEVVDSLGNIIQYTLDAMGNRIKEDVFDPADHLVKAQQRIYDGLNRLYNDIGASGQTSSYFYDANSNLRTSIDPLQRSTVLVYDALNRLLTSTDPSGGATQYGYDAKSRLVSVRDPINLVTTYSYDGLGNLARLTSPDTGIATYVSDAAGNVVGSTDARGLATSYTYDALNRRKVSTFDGGAVALEYDNATTGGTFARGRLTKVGDPSGTTTYAYDALGRVVRKTQAVGSDASARSFGVAYVYSSGRLTGITFPSGRSVEYAYDAQGRVSSVTIAGLTVLGQAAYFPFGGVQSWFRGAAQGYRRDFDLDGRIASLTLGPDSGTYAEESWIFGYDSLNRLTAATLPQGVALSYAYDGDGNRKQEVRAGAATNYAYAAGANRLQSLSGATAKSFTFDAAGNMTSNGTATFGYDARGRLTQLSTGYRYSINGLGQRVAKSGPGVATGTNYFVYDEQGHLIGEYDATGSAIEELVYLGDMPVFSVRSTTSGGVDLYPIYSDHLNTPRLITNAANQKVWEWKTDTFGAGAANENPSGLGNFSFNLRFPGQYFDSETGLHYNYFRDYDPSVGRYVQSDLIGLRGGMNTFAYVESSPLAGADPFGLAGEGSGFSIRYGNWCGKNWSGGRQGPIIPENPAGPIDSVDECCMTHDYCYAKYECETCSSSRDAKAGKRVCDLAMVSCMDALKGKPPQTWPRPPSIQNETNAYFFCQKAKFYFR